MRLTLEGYMRIKVEKTQYGEDKMSLWIMVAGFLCFKYSKLIDKIKLPYRREKWPAFSNQCDCFLTNTLGQMTPKLPQWNLQDLAVM